MHKRVWQRRSDERYGIFESGSRFQRLQARGKRSFHQHHQSRRNRRQHPQGHDRVDQQRQNPTWGRPEPSQKSWHVRGSTVRASSRRWSVRPAKGNSRTTRARAVATGSSAHHSRQQDDQRIRTGLHVQSGNPRKHPRKFEGKPTQLLEDYVFSTDGARSKWGEAGESIENKTIPNTEAEVKA